MGGMGYLFLTSVQVVTHFFFLFPRISYLLSAAIMTMLSYLRFLHSFLFTGLPHLFPPPPPNLIHSQRFSDRNLFNDKSSAAVQDLCDISVSLLHCISHTWARPSLSSYPSDIAIIVERVKPVGITLVILRKRFLQKFWRTLQENKQNLHRIWRKSIHQSKDSQFILEMHDFRDLQPKFPKNRCCLLFPRFTWKSPAELPEK